MENDEERYRRFLTGDDNGLREIIDIYHAGLTLFVNGIVGDLTETEDIVQDTFVKLAVKKPRFNGRCSFKTWLYTIARNKAYNYMKRHRARFTEQSIDELFMLLDGTNLERDYLRSKQNTYGLTSFLLKDGSLEQLPAGTMLKITWSGMIAESYPSKLEGVTSVTLANDLANPDRKDFVTENLPALIEACRGKDDYSDEIEKLTGLKKCEKDALMWLVGNELFSETR